MAHEKEQVLSECLVERDETMSRVLEKLRPIVSDGCPCKKCEAVRNVIELINPGEYHQNDKR